MEAYCGNFSPLSFFDALCMQSGDSLCRLQAWTTQVHQDNMASKYLMKSLCCCVQQIFASLLSLAPSHGAQIELFRWYKFVMCISVFNSFVCAGAEGAGGWGWRYAEWPVRHQVLQQLAELQAKLAAYQSTCGLPKQQTAHQYVTADSHADGGRPAPPEGLLRVSAQASVPGVS